MSPFPVLVFITHLVVLAYQRSVQVQNRASMSTTRLYSDHSDANRLMNRRNRNVNVLMGASLLIGACIAYYLMLPPAGLQSLLANSMLVSIAEITPAQDAASAIGILFALLCVITGFLVARQLHLQTRETEALLETNFLEDRVSIEQLNMIEDRLGEMNEVLQRFVAEEKRRLREEAMRQIK